MTETVSSPSADVLRSLLAERWSCRGFLPDPLPRETIDEILELAGRSPSWCNTQPWQVVVTEGEGTDRFRDGLTSHILGGGTGGPDFAFPSGYSGAHRERRLECALQLYDAVGIERGDREASGRQTWKNFELFGAPHVAIVSTPGELGTYGAVDCGVWVSTFLLAAQSLGVAAIPQAALAAYAPFVREHLGLEDDRLVVCGISFGRPDPDHAANGFRTTRVGAAATTTWLS
ncbi:nitroreductase [Mumia flava]|uniref:Nitroreductase n=1 Tax=Mumia flava TaxID=1348852 RepID=A0A0B2BU39_9ACTN|nr:nitroreductase [Mumia flava]PJJ57054.1 nitroreductase [Mumia flava]